MSNDLFISRDKHNVPAVFLVHGKDGQATEQSEERTTKQLVNIIIKTYIFMFSIL